MFVFVSTRPTLFYTIPTVQQVYESGRVNIIFA